MIRHKNAGGKPRRRRHFGLAMGNPPLPACVGTPDDRLARSDQTAASLVFIHKLSCERQSQDGSDTALRQGRGDDLDRLDTSEQHNRNGGISGDGGGGQDPG